MSQWIKVPIEDVRERVIKASCSLYRYDRELLEVDANERGVRCVITRLPASLLQPVATGQEFRRGFSAVASDWPAVVGWPTQPSLTPVRTEQT